MHASFQFYYSAIEVYSIATNDDSDSDEDDGLYVIDHIDQYLEGKNMDEI